MADIKAQVKQLGAAQETAYTAHKALLEMVTRASAPGSESQRKELAEALAGELTAKTADAEPAGKKADAKKKKEEHYTYPAPVRVKIARLLSFVAGEAEVMSLMDALRDLDVREMARFSLDFNTSSPAATKALILALDDVGPEFRIGAIGALGRRGTPDALLVLQSIAQNDTDDEVRMSAAEQLARFPDPANDTMIVKAIAGHCKKRSAVARLRLAETLRLAGKNKEAGAIYRSIESSDVCPKQKKAATIGLKAIA